MGAASHGGEQQRGSAPSTGAAEVSRAFARALLAGDEEAAACHLSARACLLTADGTEILGRKGARELLGQITTAEHALEIRVGRSVVSGDIALSTQFWRRHSRPDSSTRYEQSSTARLVLAVEEQAWKIVILSPWDQR
jgi:ketosteroid isomerase-like protein